MQNDEKIKLTSEGFASIYILLQKTFLGEKNH